MDLFFYKGEQNILDSEKRKSDRSEPEKLKAIKEAFLKVLDNKNLSFLLGSGCSSYEKDGEKKGSKVQLGIPVMAPLAKEFYSNNEPDNAWLKKNLQIDVADVNFATNLEKLLSTLHSLSFYHSQKSKQNEEEEELNTAEEKVVHEKSESEMINCVIKNARDFLLEKCLNEGSSDDELQELYKEFYRKLLTRNSTLPRLNIFTTNYDLYSERAMDSLGIHYVNGFTGGITKFFNPSIFNYALAEKMDLSQSKWSVIDNFIYLYKLHGSVNWIESEKNYNLFKVRELQDPTFDKMKGESTVMIHPTPLKYSSSLASPYSDLFREFQKKLMQNNNILVTIGYSFSDEHINNLIFQAFTIPSFRLIVIGEPTSSNTIGKLKEMGDSRIWIIGENTSFDSKKTDSSDSDEKSSQTPIHYFKRFVEEILPDLTAEDLDRKMEKTFNDLKQLLND